PDEPDAPEQLGRQRLKHMRTLVSERELYLSDGKQDANSPRPHQPRSCPFRSAAKIGVPGPSEPPKRSSRTRRRRTLGCGLLAEQGEWLVQGAHRSAIKSLSRSVGMTSRPRATG